MTMTKNLLSTRAMLAHPTFGRWGASKIDKSASAETVQRAGATDGAAKVTKRLAPKEELEAIASLDSEAYAYHIKHTLPWLDNGARLLNVAIYPEYTQRMADFRERREALVLAFRERYREILRRAPALLGELYDPADYPAESEIASKFKFSVKLFPVPTGDDFRVDLSDDALNLIRRDLQAETDAALNAALGDAFRRIADVCGAMVDRLTAYKPATGKDKAQGIFRDSLVNNVSDLVLLLPVLNITNDPRLSALAEQMRLELCKFDADDLRADEHARATTAQAAQSILDSVQAFFS